MAYLAISAQRSSACQNVLAMINGKRLDPPTAEGASIEFAFSIPSLLLVALMPLGAIILAVAVYLIAFGTTDRTSWRLTAPPSGTELQIGVYVGGCDRFEHVAVKERDGVVLVAAYLRNDVLDSCDTSINIEPKTVQLRAPLGDRSLHGCNPSNSVYPERGISDDDCANTYRH
jgi:hypothetical protein